MKASDALKLSMKEFMVEASKAISPKPWWHAPGPWRAGTNQMGAECRKCHEPVYNEFGCPVPPKLTEAPEVLARQLRDQCDKSKLKQAVSLLCPDEYAELADGDNWFAYNATPQEQIVCCLVALGLMEI